MIVNDQNDPSLTSSIRRQLRQRKIQINNEDTDDLKPFRSFRKGKDAHYGEVSKN